MQLQLPGWAIKTADASQRTLTEIAHKRNTAIINLNNRNDLRQWMRGKNWKTSWIFLENAFYKELFKNDENFALAIKENVVTIKIPKENYLYPDENLREIDKEYHSSEWSFVVAALRDIRRAIEAGVIIQLDGKTLKSVAAFYSWAHDRYHLLEESSDKWIGDDN